MAEAAARWLNVWLGEPVDGGPPPADHSGVVRFSHAEGFGDEGYRLTIAPEAVAVEASGGAGFFYAVQTLRQMLPPEAEFSAAFPRAT